MHLYALVTITYLCHLFSSSIIFCLVCDAYSFRPKESVHEHATGAGVGHNGGVFHPMGRPSSNWMASVCWIVLQLFWCRMSSARSRVRQLLFPSSFREILCTSNIQISDVLCERASNSDVCRQLNTTGAFLELSFLIYFFVLIFSYMSWLEQELIQIADDANLWWQSSRRGARTAGGEDALRTSSSAPRRQSRPRHFWYLMGRKVAPRQF